MWLDQDPEMAMEQEKQYQYLYNHANNTFSVIKSAYDSPLSFPVEFLSDRVLDDFEARRVYQVFFNQPHFKELRVIRENMEDIYMRCIFTNPKRHEYGINGDSGVVGFSATMTLDSPWARTAEKTVTLTPDANGKAFIYNDSDSRDYIYPNAEITLLNNNTGYNCQTFITNQSDQVLEYNGSVSVTSYYTTINSLAGDVSETITMRPKLGSITTDEPDNSNGTLPITRSNKRFIRLVHGVNIFIFESSINGAAPIIIDNSDFSVKLTYREDRILL